MKKKDTTYWAEDDTQTCADAIMERCEDYWSFCLSRGLFTNWRRLYYAYNPNRYTGGATFTAGESGEYRSIKMNIFKNLLEHIATLTITDRPAWKPKATNSDSKSAKQCYIAEGLLDYMMREKRVERHIKDATRNAVLFGEGFVSTIWDPTLGETIAVDPETGEKTSNGDLHYNSHEPVDVVRDPNLPKFSDRQWVVVRTMVDKYQLAARFPEYRDEIINQEYGLTTKDHYLYGNITDRSLKTDLIPVLNFYHVKNEACPNGRQMTLLQDGTPLTDSVLLYKHLPIHRIVPGDQINTPMGQSVSLDMLPIQEMIDGHYTTMMSINENMAIPKILIPIGSQVQTDDMATGFQVINYNPQSGKPEVMAMPTAPNGLFDAIKLLTSDMQGLSGINDVVRGQAPGANMSGSAMALLTTQTLQFHAPLQQSYIQLLEDIGTATIQIMQDYASTPRVIEIAGKRNRGLVQQSFKNTDIDSISRVHVEVANPLSKTASGRLAMAQDLLQNKIVTDPQEYLQVMMTGELDPLVQGTTQVLMSLSAENEALTDGQPAPVFFTDDHVLHIHQHTAVASDPAVRGDPVLMAALNDHIQQHVKFLMDPNYQQYRQIMGQPSLGSTAMPAGQGGMAPLQPPPNQPGGQVQQQAAGINQPNLPKIAGTNQRIQPGIRPQ